MSATKTAAIELADRGIRVNCVCPGPIEMPMLDDPDAVDEASIVSVVDGGMAAGVAPLTNRG